MSISCTVTDAGVGMLKVSDASFALTTNVPANTQTAKASTNTRSVCDRLGHCATAGPIPGIKIDKVSPILSITTPADGAIYSFAETVLVSYTCTDPAGGSGIAPGRVRGDRCQRDRDPHIARRPLIQRDGNRRGRQRGDEHRLVLGP